MTTSDNIKNRLFHYRSGKVSQRIVEKIDTRYRILKYGLDNVYPQRMEQLRLASPLVKGATELKRDFIDGEGFENLGDTVVNEEGQNLNDILRLIAEDKAIFDGWALWLNFDGNGAITEVYHLPFPWVRYGQPNSEGQVFEVAVSNNWEEQTQRYPDWTGMPDPDYLPLYNPLTAAVDTITGGRGQVLYVVPHKYTYPTATLDSVMNAAATDAEVQVFELSNITNGFLSATLFRYPSDITDEAEKKRIKRKFSEMTGALNANSSIMMQVPEDFTGSIIEQIPANANDSLFLNTVNHVRDTILQAYQIPPSLMGVLPEGSFITAEQIQDAYIYYNLRTKNERRHIVRVFEELGFAVGGIIEQEFINPNLPVQNRPPEQVEEETDTEVQEEEESAVEEAENG